MGNAFKRSLFEKKITLINYFRYKLKESITIKNAIKKNEIKPPIWEDCGHENLQKYKS
jgi:hypothetical protein